jgi:hypothetical protein
VARPPGPRFFVGPIATGRLAWYFETGPYKDPNRRREYGRDWIKRNPENAGKTMQRWRQRHPAEHAAEVQSHYERHKKRLAGYLAQYRREHRDVRQRASARRHARKLGAPGSFTTVEWVWLLQFWNWTCAYCGKTSVALQPDHRCRSRAEDPMPLATFFLPAPRVISKALLSEDEFRARLAAERDRQRP